MDTIRIDNAPPLRSPLFRYEDLAGKLVLLAFFAWLFKNAMLGSILMIRQPQHDVMWYVNFASQLSSLFFVSLVVGLTIFRKPARDVAQGIEARISAFFGTFILLLLIAVPRAEIGGLQTVVATVLILVGTVLSVWCLWWLGRSFSVMATARELQVRGPYALVRHPLYAVEALTVIGVVLYSGSLIAYAVGVAQFYFQYRRMLNEEEVLARAFPEYAGYKQTTPMILPRLAGLRKAIHER